MSSPKLQVGSRSPVVSRQSVVTTLLAGLAGALCLTLSLNAAADSPVADAARRGDRAVVRSLLKQGGDVNAAQGDGMTALHWAAERNDAELAQTLLYAGANTKATTRLGGYTPLLLAAKNGGAAVIDVLLKAGADANAANANGTTPLMFAAASGNVDAVALLIDRGANVNATEHVRGLDALMFAAAADRTAVVDLLAKRGANLKATSKVVDLAGLSRDPSALQGIIFGNPAPPPKPGDAPKDQRLPAPASAAGKNPEWTEGHAGAARENAPKADSKNAAAKEGGPAKESAPKPEAETAKKEPAPFEQNRQFAPPRRGQKPQVPGVDRQFLLNELVAAQGGLSPLHFAAREGHMATVQALLNDGADINQVTTGDHTTPLLIAVINGQFDVAKYLLDHGADANIAAENGAAPLYDVINLEWSPKALYPQPQAYLQQKTSYLDLMKALLDKGADPNKRLNKKTWYQGYSFDLSGVDEIGATPFWRAAYASDVEAMKLLVKYGADPNIPTMKPAGRPRVGDGERDVKDVSGLPPVPLGGPGIPPIVAASGAGYGEGFAANSHRYAPTGMLAAVKYLVEDLHADVNAKDHEGNTALHNAAARGDNDMILYLVSKGADVKVVNREGKTTVDMANGPVQRIQPFPETIALLEKLGAKNHHHCVSCD